MLVFGARGTVTGNGKHLCWGEQAGSGGGGGGRGALTAVGRGGGGKKGSVKPAGKAAPSSP